MAKKKQEDPAMSRVRDAFEHSKLSLHDLGMKMGYPADTARKSAWQFIRLTHDPRLGMLRKFADAVAVPLSELIDGK